MSEHTSAVIEAQVDWLTCSSHSESRSLELDGYADYLIECQEAVGNKRTGWRSMGYVGYHAGDVDWGKRDDRQSIIRVSGGRAAQLLPKILPMTDNCSRLDVAVTWRAVPSDPHLGENTYALALNRYRERRNAMRPKRVSDGDGGFTCYLGDERAPYYARVYNKEAERASQRDAKTRAHYEGCWRYEVEAHDQRALALASAVADAPDTAGFCQQFLFDWFTSRGIPPAFPTAGTQALVEGFHRRTDDESSLRHLERNVRPTLKRLAAHGRSGDAREALGLDSSNLLLTQLERLLRS